MATAQRVQKQDVRTAVGGQPLEQVLFDRYAVYVGPEQGGVMDRVKEGRRAVDHIRPRPDPPAIRPRSVPGLLDRTQELGAIGQALARGLVVDLHGPDGMGKTALISQTMHTQLSTAFPAGQVYLTAGQELYEDLLQDLFGAFYEADRHVKMSENEVRGYMAGKRALIAVDDANRLDPRQAEALAQVAPQCAVLIAGQKQQVWQGASVAMTGLPGNEAVTLFERYWGHALGPDRPTAESICAVLNNVPLATIKAATIAASRQVSLPEMLYWLQTAAPQYDAMGRAFQAIARRFSDGERQVMAALAAPGGAAVGVEAVAFITGLAPESVGKYLNRLQKMRLVYASDARYGLDEGLLPYVRQAWVDQGMRARAAEYYGRNASRLQVHSKDPDEDNVLLTLDYYYGQQQWRQVVQIARAAERYLAKSGRWGQWRLRLRQAWHAAQELGDRATEAWAQNQLAVIATSLGETAAATTLFEGALAMWRLLGNRAGITIARWNLQVLLGPPPGPPPKGKQPAGPGGGGSVLPIALGATATALLILLVLLGVYALQPTTTPTPIPPATKAVVLVPTLPPPTVVTPQPTTAVPPTTPPPPCACGDKFCNTASGCGENRYNCPADCCVCGDGVCDASSPCNELATSCPADCCVCGDGVCSGGPPCNESVASCGVDCCVCGDGVCARESPCYESPSSCPGDCPLADLVVPALETVGANTVTSDGGVQVPIRVVIRNQGGAAADIFKVSTEYAGYSGTFALPFSVAGQDSSWYPYSEAALAAGGELAFEGTVTFSYAWDDEIVSLWASADSCAGEEFAAAYCRVLESNEDNNQSGAISVDIRAPVIYNILTDPEAPVEGAPLSIVASISDGSEVDRAELWYTYIPNVGISVEGYVVVPMERVDDLRWRVVLGPFDAGELRYGIAAWDEAGNNSQTNKIIVQVQYIVD